MTRFDLDQKFRSAIFYSAYRVIFLVLLIGPIFSRYQIGEQIALSIFFICLAVAVTVFGYDIRLMLAPAKEEENGHAS